MEILLNFIEQQKAKEKEKNGYANKKKKKHDSVQKCKQFQD